MALRLGRARRDREDAGGKPHLGPSEQSKRWWGGAPCRSSEPRPQPRCRCRAGVDDRCCSARRRGAHSDSQPRPQTRCRCRSGVDDRCCSGCRIAILPSPRPPRPRRRGRSIAGKRAASQGISRDEATRNMLHVEAELPNLVEPARQTRKPIAVRFMRSHETAWLSVRSVKSESSPMGRGAPLPRR